MRMFRVPEMLWVVSVLSKVVLMLFLRLLRSGLVRVSGRFRVYDLGLYGLRGLIGRMGGGHRRGHLLVSYLDTLINKVRVSQRTAM